MAQRWKHTCGIFGQKKVTWRGCDLAEQGWWLGVERLRTQIQNVSHFLGPSEGPFHVMSICHISGQSTQVTLKPYWWGHCHHSTQMSLGLSPFLCTCSWLRVSQLLSWKTASDIRKPEVTRHRHPWPMTGWCGSVEAQLPQHKLGSMWEQNLGPRVPCGAGLLPPNGGTA